MKIIPLSEGTFTIDKTKIFVSFELDKDELQQRPIGSLLVEVQPFVVITKNDVILIDTGLGFSNNGMLQLHQNLINNGIQPTAVTKVLMSHLHKDHAGGVSKRDHIGNYTLSCPNAIYYVQEQEFVYAMETGYPSYMTDEFSVLENHSNVVWLNGNGLIDNYIRYEITSAHSKFHQVFWIEEDDETVFFGGDDAPQLQQMKSKFVAKYDYDGKKCMELRQQWWQDGNHEHWQFLFYHDIKTPVFKK
ncbi:MAG TPA: MBL fold metallo-hydrolase [Chitinophagaceae bacterium]|jgi:glyoxylase-like metal-dependent hydrolase (beta-lactamase superfamily II)|nr:MBL fold metallo-hydrolase [Chitinophagaceae bacterium]